MAMLARNVLYTSHKTTMRACVRVLAPPRSPARSLVDKLERGDVRPLVTVRSSSRIIGADGADNHPSVISPGHKHLPDNSLRQRPDAVDYVTLDTEGVPLGVMQPSTLQPLAATAAIAALMSSEYATSRWLTYQASKTDLAMAPQVQEAQKTSAKATPSHFKVEADLAATKAAASMMIDSLLQQVQELAAAGQLQTAKDSLALPSEIQEKLFKSEEQMKMFEGQLRESKKQLQMTVAHADRLQQTAVTAYQMAAAAENKAKVLQAKLAAEELKSTPKPASKQQVVQLLLEAARWIPGGFFKESGLSPYAVAAVAAPPTPEAPPKEALAVVPIDAAPSKPATSNSGVAAVRVKEFLDVQGLGEVEVMTGPRGGRFYINRNGKRSSVTAKQKARVYTREVPGSAGY